MGEARQIYTDACGEIAAAFEPAGFRFRKSKHDLVKQDGDLTFRIWFQSSFRNVLIAPAKSGIQFSRTSLDVFLPLKKILGEVSRLGSVSFITHISVHDAAVKRWRARLQHPVRTDDIVAGTNIGYIAPERTWLEVNLANAKVRGARIRCVTELVRAFGLPYFERFRRPDIIVAELIESGDPGMLDFMELEYAVCYGDIEAGRRVLERHLVLLPDCIDEYKKALSDYRDQGIPEALDGRPGPRLARMALSLGLDNPKQSRKA